MHADVIHISGTHGVHHPVFYSFIQDDQYSGSWIAVVRDPVNHSYVGLQFLLSEDAGRV